MSAAIIITRFMREVEYLRDALGLQNIALRGFDHEPVSPFPLLSAAEILGVLHPADLRWPK
jgi:hypothetical protein